MGDVSESIGIMKVYIINTRINQFRNDFVCVSYKSKALLYFTKIYKNRYNFKYFLQREREREAIYLQNVEIAYTLKVHNIFCTQLVVLFLGKDKKYGRPYIQQTEKES